MNLFERFFKPVTGVLALLLITFMAGCGGGGRGNPSGDSASNGPTGGACTGSACVPLGTAANYAILAKTGVATVPPSVVTGHVGLSPAARTFLTGWSQTYDVTDTHATSAQVIGSGRLYASDNVGGNTSSDLTTAVLDMQTAYTDAAGRTASSAATVDVVPVR